MSDKTPVIYRVNVQSWKYTYNTNLNGVDKYFQQMKDLRVAAQNPQAANSTQRRHFNEETIPKMQATHFFSATPFNDPKSMTFDEYYLREKYFCGGELTRENFKQNLINDFKEFFAEHPQLTNSIREEFRNNPNAELDLGMAGDYLLDKYNLYPGDESSDFIKSMLDEKLDDIVTTHITSCMRETLEDLQRSTDSLESVLPEQDAACKKELESCNDIESKKFVKGRYPSTEYFINPREDKTKVLNTTKDVQDLTSEYSHQKSSMYTPKIVWRELNYEKLHEQGYIGVKITQNCIDEYKTLLKQQGIPYDSLQNPLQGVNVPTVALWDKSGYAPIQEPIACLSRIANDAAYIQSNKPDALRLSSFDSHSQYMNLDTLNKWVQQNKDVVIHAVQEKHITAQDVNKVVKMSQERAFDNIAQKLKNPGFIRDENERER